MKLSLRSKKKRQQTKHYAIFFVDHLREVFTYRTRGIFRSFLPELTLNFVLTISPSASQLCRAKDLLKKTPQWRFEWKIFIHVLPPLFASTLVNNFLFPHVQYHKWYQRKVVHSFDHHMHFLFNSHTLRNLQDKCQGFGIVFGREICRTLTIKLCLITSHFNISCATQAQFFSIPLRFSKLAHFRIDSVSFFISKLS